ncbi:MAG: hypothetical protein ACI9W4_001230 [Rhodothermales bacterium]|jgi:hypothetical protein
MKFSRPIALSAVLALALVGCDFQAAEDAFDEFSLIIELEPINTVVNGIVVDNNTGNLIAATLEFSGSGAGVLVDAYSDPLTSLNAENGVVTFGLQNAVVPSESSPVELTVTATADGFYTSSQTFEITEIGDAQFTVSLSSSNIAASVVGTTSTSNSSTTTDSGGAVTQQVTVTTQQNAQTSSTASVAIAQGAVPVTAAGTPLTGQLTVDVRSYDSGAGLQALPAAAKQRSDGSNQAIGGAAFFKMTDSNGNVAVGAVAAPSGLTAAKSAGVCTGGILISLKSTDAALQANYDLLVSAGSGVDAKAYAYTPADGNNVLVADTFVETDGAGLKVDLCLGGGSGDTGVINTSAIGDASQGIIYTYAFDSALVNNGTLSHQVAVGGLTGTQNIEFTVAGPGLNLRANKSVANGTYSLASLVGASGSFDAVTQASYSLSAKYVGSTQVTAIDISSPLSGTSSLTMPATSDLQTFSITASLQCPAGQKFEVQITSGSLDAVSTFYRIAGNGESWTVLGSSAITSKVAEDDKIEIKGNLSLKPSTPYDFKGVLGIDASTTMKTTPGAGAAWLIALEPEDVGMTCETR